MKFSKFLMIISIVTFSAIIYVYQQSKIIEMAYKEQGKLEFLESLIDKGNTLRYNINRQLYLISETGVSKEAIFEWPHKSELISLSTEHQSGITDNQIEGTENLFTRLFGLKSQAEATPINPR